MKDFASDFTNIEKNKKKKAKIDSRLTSLSVEKVGLCQYLNYWL